VEMHLQCTGRQSWCKQLWTPLGCSLKAFNTDGWNEYGSTLLSTLELKTCALHPSVNPYRRAINDCCLPGFHQNPVFTLPVFQLFYLRHMTEFQNSKFLGTPVVGTRVVPPREGLNMLLLFVGPVCKKASHNYAAICSL